MPPIPDPLDALWGESTCALQLATWQAPTFQLPELFKQTLSFLPPIFHPVDFSHFLSFFVFMDFTIFI